jgi:hypothetical protein
VAEIDSALKARRAGVLYQPTVGSPLTGDASETFPLVRERHTNSSARTTVETAAMHPPAISIKLKPPKLKTQITLAIEPMHIATSSTE